MPVDLTYADATVARIGRHPDALIPILQSLQEQYGYLPEEALRRVCDTTEITPAAIAGVASFYDMFRHAPVGKHLVRVCVGTACHVAGAGRVEDALRRHLKIKQGRIRTPTVSSPSNRSPALAAARSRRWCASATPPSAT